MEERAGPMDRADMPFGTRCVYKSVVEKKVRDLNLNCANTNLFSQVFFSC